jgi:hypothetical protein
MYPFGLRPGYGDELAQNLESNTSDLPYDIALGHKVVIPRMTSDVPAD